MLSIIKNDLKNAFYSHTLLTVILIVGLIVSFFTVKMMLGVVQFQINAAKNLNSLHSFTVDFNGKFSANDYERIDNIKESGVEMPNVLLIKTSKSEPMLIGFWGRNDNRWYVHDEGAEISPTDEHLATKNVVISPGLYNRPDFNYQDYPLVIEGQSFNIIGVGIIPQNNLFINGNDLYKKYYPPDEQVTDLHGHEHEDTEDYVEVKYQYQTVLMPYSTFCEQNYNVDLVTFLYQYSSSEEFEQFSALLRDTFPKANLHFPTMPKEHYASDMQKQLIQALLLIFAALINIAALFVYWLSVNRRVHGVYMLCGATRIRTIIIMLSEWATLVLISFLLSFCIEKLTTPLFTSINVTFDFSLWDTILMLVGGYVVTVMFMLPQIHRNANLSQRGYIR